MSSLAGALDDNVPSTSHYGHRTSGVEMVPQYSNRFTNPEGDEDEEMTDLFGNDNDVEEFQTEKIAASPTASGPDSLPSPERERRQALEYEEDDALPDIAVEVKEAEVSFPNIPVPRSSDGDNWVIRTPNFVKVDSKPFHPDTYIGPEHEDEETLQAENVKERSMTIKLKVENTLRWRWIKDGNGQDKRQSNSRVVRWSDGSLSLRLGKELFDITQSIDTSGGVSRQTVGASRSSSQQPASQSQASSLKSQGLTYLVAQHKRSQVLQSEAVITGYMSLRPTGMQSETHRMLVRAVGQKHNKIARLKMAPDPIMDPEREKLELLKQSAKKAKKKNDYDDGLGGGRKRRYSRRTAEHDVWSDDEDDIGTGFAGSEEDDEDGLRSSPKKHKRKISDEKDAEGYQEDDFLVADSDEDGGTGKKKRKEDIDVEEEDPLDKLDAKIEQQDNIRRRESGEKVGNLRNDEEKEGMDVESEEEDEEDLPVRRAAGSRRKAAVSFDEEEEE